MVGKTVSHYRILEKLGGGGMGVVYKAEDTRLGRVVALKFLPAVAARDGESASPGSGQRLLHELQALKRFKREARVIAALNHPHICAIHDIDEYEGQPFLVMECIAGTTLRQRLQERSSVGEFLVLALQCVEALGAAHEKGIVHGDLKPENIMVTAAGQAKILDFGIARRMPPFDEIAVTESLATMAESFCGTLAYMAPEVLLNKAVDGRADIFSLGVVFYEVLTGRHPFLAGSFVATSNRILNEQPVPVSRLNPEIPAALDPVIMRMLAKQPGERYTAGELLAELRRLRAGQPAPGLPPISRKRWRARLRAAGFAGAALAAAILVWAAVPSARRLLVHWLRSFASPVSHHPSFTERGRVLMGHFDNRTGDPLFDRTLEELLSTTLDQSRYLSLFPPSQLAEVLRRMERPPTLRIDEAIGLEICQREGLEALVLGSIARLGQHYVLAVRALDPEGVSLFGGSRVASGQNAIAPALDDLAAQLRARLGESAEAIHITAQPLDRVTSKSLEAVRYFSLGKRELHAGNWRQASELMARAVELDPEFAMAYEYLGVADYILRRAPDCRRNLARAVQLSHHATQRERYKILGDYDLLVSGDPMEAIAHYRVLLQLYPDDQPGHANLALAYDEAEQFDQAAREAEAAVRLSDDPVGRDNLACDYFVAGRPDRAIQTDEANLAAYPQSTVALKSLGQFYLQEGKTERAEGYFRQLVRLGGAEAADGHRGLADLDWSGGRYGSALDELQMALRADQQAGDRVREAGTRLHMASLFLEQNARQRARQEAFRAANLAEQPETLARAVALLAQAGDVEAGRAVLRRLEAAGPRCWVVQPQAELLLAQGKAGEALRLLEEDVHYKFRTLALETWARAHWAARQFSEAAADYQQVLVRQAELAVDAADAPAFHRAVETYYRLGVLEQQQGGLPEAQKDLQRFLDYFRSSDPHAPFVSDARERLKRLAGRGSG